MKLKHLLATLLITTAIALPAQATETYKFDIKGQHAFIQFKVKHLGYSWLIGNFNTFDGSFTYDEQNPANNTVDASVDVASVFSNHAERDKHLRSADFFDVAEYSTATFKSSKYEKIDATHGKLTGTLKLRGVEKVVTFNVEQIGAGDDPWGGFRRGFTGTTTLHLSDYGMPFAPKLGPASENVELSFSIEGLRQ